MLYAFLLYTTALFCFGSILILFGIHGYIALFQAEKMRRKIIALPEFRPTWFYLVDLTRPFKWWHFYRRGLFSILLSQARMKARHKSKLLLPQKVYGIMPKRLDALYCLESWNMLFFAIGIALTYFLQKYFPS